MRHVELDVVVPSAILPARLPPYKPPPSATSHLSPASSTSSELYQSKPRTEGPSRPRPPASFICGYGTDASIVAFEVLKFELRLRLASGSHQLKCPPSPLTEFQLKPFGLHGFLTTVTLCRRPTVHVECRCNTCRTPRRAPLPNYRRPLSTCQPIAKVRARAMRRRLWHRLIGLYPRRGKVKRRRARNA